MNVAFLIFNRPAMTERVFAEIVEARPARLLVVADGPRPDRSDDPEKCAAARAIIERVDWPCEVLKNYADTNLGCKRRVSSGLDWVFENVEEAVILEDDCLPHPTFFPYCAELLDRYRDDTRVMHISGYNFLGRFHRTTRSFRFSKYPHIWGWASWRRAWCHYDVNMSHWPAFRDQGLLRGVCPDPQEQTYWTNRFNTVYSGQIDTWDYEWFFACWRQSGLAVMPEVNLVSNIGFGDESTHTHDQDSWLADLPIKPMAFPMRYPPEVVVSQRADRIFFQRAFLLDPGLIRHYRQRIGNRYFWGAQVRRLPLIGKLWAYWRCSRV